MVPEGVVDENDDDALDLEPLGSGVEAVRAALNRARAAAEAKGLRPSAPGSVPPLTSEQRHEAARRRVNARRRGGGYSGAGPDDRDPQAFGSLIGRLVAEKGWGKDIAVGSVVGRWDQIVGEEVAAHAKPETFTEGVLTIRTDSTAWATQMRLLAPRLHERLRGELGEDVVTKLVILGPVAPSWRKGPRTAPGGRGPRDTYG